jgi:hypothetical protein
MSYAPVLRRPLGMKRGCRLGALAGGRSMTWIEAPLMTNRFLYSLPPELPTRRA